MASGTMVKRVLVQIAADDADAEAKLDRISVKADELKEKHPTLAVRIDTAAASAKLAVLRQELKATGDAGQLAGAQASSGFSSAFSGGLMNPYVLGAGLTAALAGLPAIAASGGALAGIALGTYLLVGTKKVQGPLYAQFHTMMDGLTSVLRVSALPLVKPLAEAFRQVGQFAKQMYPVLHSIFASLGPLVAPLTRGFEGLVRGILPGFLNLMRAAQPAVQALAGLLSQLGSQLGATFNALIPGVRSSAQFMRGLGTAVTSLLPLVGNLANIAARLLGPIMAQLGGKLLPLVADALDKVLISLSPLMPPLARLVAIGLQFSVAPMVAALQSLANMLVALEGPIQTVANMLATLVGWAQTALSWLSKIPGLGGLFSGAGISFGGGGIPAVLGGPGLSGPELGGGGGFSVPSGSGGWGAGVTGSPGSGAGGRGARGAHAAGKRAGQQIAPALAAGLIAGLQGSQSQIGHATLSILKVIWGDEKAGLLTRGEASDLAKWVKADNQKLQALAVQRNKIAKEIAAARQYAANVASNVEGQFGIVNAGQGVNNAPASSGQIIATLQEEVRRTRSFGADIKKLAKMGLNKAYLAQLIQAGPVQGGPIADELANGPLGDIKAINAAEAGIASAATGLGQLGADVIYDRGAIGKRFLVDLERQEKQTQLAMRKLAELMVGATRQALKVEFVGGANADADFIRFLKRYIRIHGGNPAVLGR